MSKAKLDTKSIGLDVGLNFFKWLTGAENLHYGLWDGLEHDAMNVRRAQEAYTELLFSFLPEGKLKILDIGGGAGETAKKLLAMGHSVDIVVPSALLVERCKVNAPEARVFEQKFEDYEAEAGSYDLALFSESFQYIPYDIALAKAKLLTKDEGAILICDCFRRADFVPDKVKAQVGYGHRIDLVRSEIESLGLNTTRAQDVTASAAPSIDIEQGFYHVIGHAWTRLDQEIETKRPFIGKVIHWVFRRLTKERRRIRLNQRFMENTRTAETFMSYNEYWFMRLEK